MYGMEHGGCRAQTTTRSITCEPLTQQSQDLLHTDQGAVYPVMPSPHVPPVYIFLAQLALDADFSLPIDTMSSAR